MKREDLDLAFLLQYENVAWFEKDHVRILDRRIYPSKIEFVECKTYQEVVKAIQDMVTQSAGPYTAAGMGMALAAFQAKELTKEKQLAFLKQAQYEITNARVTTANRYGLICSGCYEAAKQALENNSDPVDAIVQRTIDSLNRRYATMEKVAEHLVRLIPDNGVILTQCFGETIIGMMCRVLKRENKKATFYCAETRPYFQGARLTASVIYDMGFEVTVITDNMVAYLMQNAKVDIFTSAADTITLDGHIVNKIGTFQIAILANHFGIPYFVTGIPDADKQDYKQIKIENRDPSQVLYCYGVHNTLDGVKAIYPSFDITPSHLIGGVVTDRGVFSPYDLKTYFEKGDSFFY